MPKIFIVIVFCLGFSFTSNGQDVVRNIDFPRDATVEVVNHFGRVSFVAQPFGPDQRSAGKIIAASPARVREIEVKVETIGTKTIITVGAKDDRKRVDLTIYLPEGSSVKADTEAGAVNVSGYLAAVSVKTETGTIALEIPTDDVSYQLLWTESRPRFVSDFELSPVKERSAGRFEIKGHFPDQRSAGGRSVPDEADARPSTGTDSSTPEPSNDGDKPRAVSLNITTARGIVLVNVPPDEVGSDLRERPLTNAAKAIVRSGDSLLMEAIRRAAPKYYGDYARSLPPYQRQPEFAVKTATADASAPGDRDVLVRVTDLRNRAIPGLEAKDFEVTEYGAAREIVSVRESTAPFNLVLLLDVSGSVENYVNFIRKAARNFIETVDKRDRVSVVIFNDDVKVLSNFTTDKAKLSESLDTFDAGGGTAYYDALAFTVADTLRPLRGERTAIVILTDGDDNRSFLAFDSLLGSIQESGALIYPLYVPSGLIALGSQAQNADIDPLRKKYMSLTAKSEGEGEKLAKVSGGVYYPITQLSQIQKAYEDIVLQLRTAYVVTYRSESAGSGVSPRLKVKVKRDNAYATITSVTSAK